MQRTKKTSQQRDIGQELLASVKEMTANQWARKTIFTPQRNGKVKREVVRNDGTVEKTELLTATQWELMEARGGSGLSQSEFARRIGVSVRTIQEWEQGRKVPSGPARALLRITARHPELLTFKQEHSDKL